MFDLLLYTNVSKLKQRVKFPLHNTIAVYYTLHFYVNKSTHTWKLI